VRGRKCIEVCVCMHVSVGGGVHVCVRVCVYMGHACLCALMKVRAPCMYVCMHVCVSGGLCVCVC